MTASSVRAYLFALEAIGIKLGLDQIRGLLTALDRPDAAFPSVLVAGTNGKGSVTAMIERGLRAAGYRTGRYTSPHLVDVEERVAIDGTPVRADLFDEAAETVRLAARALPAPPSFFEATTAVALEAFRRAAVDIAVLEVGLGGRLDATNAVAQAATVITAIDLDHQAYLGSTVEAIAAEKAAVIKAGGPVVLARNPPSVVDVVAEAAFRAAAPLTRAWDNVRTDARLGEDGRTTVEIETPTRIYGPLVLGLRGDHQVDNAVAAVRLLEALPEVDLDVPPAAIATALTDVVWPARLEMTRWRERDILIDGAHNPAGARALCAYLGRAFGRPLPMVVGAMQDKDVEGMLSALAPCASGWWFTAAESPRAMAAGDLVATASRVAPGVSSLDAGRPMAALDAASLAGSPVVVAGSLYLCGEIRARIS